MTAAARSWLADAADRHRAGIAESVAERLERRVCVMLDGKVRGRWPRASTAGASSGRAATLIDP